MKALIIYSGGLDSTVLLHNYKNDIRLAVSFDYGSKHSQKELACALVNCGLLNTRHTIIDITSIGKNLKSALLSNEDIMSCEYSEQSIANTIVPFRNGIMLAAAAGIAESYSLDTVMIANHSGDHAIYPDCTAMFINNMNATIKAGTNNKVSLCAPFTNIDKTQIVRIGAECGVNFALTYSCYNGYDIHCGVCSTCRERKQAFVDANIKDPTEYEQ